MRTLTQRSTRRGAAAVEFALVAPLFLLLVMGMIEFGRALMVQQTLTNASRSGAREASLPDATVNSVRQLVSNQLESSGISVHTDRIQVTPNPATASANQPITVTVAVPFDDVSWLAGTFLSNMDLSASTSMRAERMD